MKKTLLCAAITLLGAATAIAQPTLTGANSNPYASEIFYGSDLDFTGLSQGAAGANVTWTLISPSEERVDTTYIYGCPATAYCDSFAGSTIVIHTLGADSIYAKTSDAAYSWLGGVSGGVVTQLATPFKQMQYPFTYTNSFTDSFGFSDAMEVFRHSVTNTADGWGKLQLATDTFNNVLRVHSVIVDYDSFSVAGMPIVLLTQSETYSWFVAGMHQPLLVMSLDTMGTGSSTPQVTELKRYRRSLPLVVVDYSDRVSFDIYPNPAVSEVNIKCNIADVASTSITVTDLAGRVVSQVSTAALKTGINTITVPVAGLPNGMYMAQLRSNGQTAVKKFVVSK